jgi:hypothetical protein
VRKTFKKVMKNHYKFKRGQYYLLSVDNVVIQIVDSEMETGRPSDILFKYLTKSDFFDRKSAKFCPDCKQKCPPKHYCLSCLPAYINREMTKLEVLTALL